MSGVFTKLLPGFGFAVCLFTQFGAVASISTGIIIPEIAFEVSGIFNIFLFV